MDKNGTKQDADRQTFEMLLAEKNEQVGGARGTRAATGARTSAQSAADCTKCRRLRALGLPAPAAPNYEPAEGTGPLFDSI